MFSLLVLLGRLHTPFCIRLPKEMCLAQLRSVSFSHLLLIKVKIIQLKLDVPIISSVVNTGLNDGIICCSNLIGIYHRNLNVFVCFECSLR